jgi:hypothetical protein
LSERQRQRSGERATDIEHDQAVTRVRLRHPFVPLGERAATREIGLSEIEDRTVIIDGDQPFVVREYEFAFQPMPAALVDRVEHLEFGAVALDQITRQCRMVGGIWADQQTGLGQSDGERGALLRPVQIIRRRQQRFAVVADAKNETALFCPTDNREWIAYLEREALAGRAHETVDPHLDPKRRGIPWRVPRRLFAVLDGFPDGFHGRVERLELVGVLVGLLGERVRGRAFGEYAAGDEMPGDETSVVAHGFAFAFLGEPDHVEQFVEPIGLIRGATAIVPRRTGVFLCLVDPNGDLQQGLEIVR